MSLFSTRRFYALRCSCVLLIAAFVVGFAPVAHASSLSPGQLIKGSSSAVYYYTQNGKRLVFPHEKVFKTWYANFSNVIQISDGELAAIPLGGNVTYHPGARLVKIISNPKVYAVGRGGVLRWLQTENVARDLYGPYWSQQVDDIADAFFVNYSLGASIEKQSDFSPSAESAAANIDPTTSAAPVAVTPPLPTSNSSSGSAPTPTPTPVPTPTPTPTSTPTNADITFTIDAAGPRTPISPYIYGTNETAKANLKLYRLGGNRLTAYNWENNASNAGIDYGPHSSDSYLSGSSVPGMVMTQAVDQARTRGAAMLLTIPIVDYVAADKNGLVTEVASDNSSRWLNNFANKPSALSSTPNMQDHAVYQDEAVRFIQQKYGGGASLGKDIFYSLDNEPGLWPSTHPLVHPAATTFAEMASRTTKFATMIKQQAPNSLVFGGVAYGYNEYTSLQGAPDAQGRDYLDFFLDNAKKAEAAAGYRVVDVLDLHWYPEARGGNIRITDGNTANPSQEEVEARVQAPRSLWDPSYKEKSWIADDVLGGPIKLLPRLSQKIATYYPGTKLAFTEYNYGGAKHISGGIAQADVLGIFGREGIFAAAFWPLTNDSTSFIYGGFDMFLNYDGAGRSVGDLSLSAQTSDAARTSIYAMVRSSNPSELTIVAINKTNQSLSIAADVAQGGSYTSALAYQLMSASMTPVPATAPIVQGSRLTTILPPLSVTTFVLKQ